MRGECQQPGAKSKFDWLHKALDVTKLVVDAADIVNAGLYAMEGDWVNAGICVASALPVIGTAVAGVTRVTKFAKAGKVIEKTLKLAGKTYATVQAATAALEMAGDAKIEYAANGGRMTLGVAAKIVGATAMTAISVAAAGSLIKDVTSLSKVSDISLNTSSQKSADLESGRCAKGTGIGCFIAGTKVKTENGEKNIEDVESGDYVLAEDPETGEQEYKKVVRTYIHEKTTLVHVFVGKEEIKTTVEHPFYVEGIGFVSAGELRTGDIVRTSDGENLPVDKVELEPLEEPVLVYNFEVEDFHTYYVSGLGVLVHNDCLGGSGSDSNYVLFNETYEKSLPKPRGKGPNGGKLQAHHGLQQEWAFANLSKYGYDPDLAPTVTIETGKGLPHTIITNLQNARRDARVASGNGKWSSSLQDELSYIVSDFRAAGFSDSTINRVLEQQYKMLDKLGVPYERIKY